MGEGDQVDRVDVGPGEVLLSIYGPPVQTDWMIWNTADPLTTNTNRAWNTNTIINSSTYNLYRESQTP